MMKNSMVDMHIKELESLGQLLMFAPAKFENTFFDFKDAKDILTLLFEEAVSHPVNNDELHI